MKLSTVFVLIFFLLVAIVYINIGDSTWDNVKKTYPFVDKHASIDGTVDFIFDPTTVHLRNWIVSVQASIDGKNMSILATTNGKLSGKGIGELLSVGDKVVKKANNDSVLILKYCERDTIVLKFIDYNEIP